MSLDELSDDQLDQRLRELLAPAPRSRPWERLQRELLVHYITTGEAALSDESPAAMGAGDGGELFELVSTPADDAPPRRWWIAAAAAAMLVTGLVITQRPAEQPAPAQQPVDIPTDAASVPASELVPALRPGALAPDRFGVVTDAWPSAASASASWGGQVGWNNSTAAHALVARSDGEFLRDGIVLSVRSDAAGDHFWGTPQSTTVAGLGVEVYVETGSPAITTVVLPGTPAVAASGLDPIAFLEAANGFPIRGARVDDAGEVTFAVDTLPGGYDVVVPPTRVTLGSVDANTRASDGDGGDGIAVWVAPRNQLFSPAQVGDLERVDINGIGGWLQDRGRGASVIWQVSDTTWATVGGASTAEDALTFARSVDFVDETTWSERYDVEQPNYPERDIPIDTTATPNDTSAVGSATEPAFTPPGSGGVGIAHYGRPDDSTQLQGDGSCLPDVCSIGVQWDDQTFASLRWVALDGGTLDQDATVESLLDLVPHLVADPTRWSPTGPTER